MKKLIIVIGLMMMSQLSQSQSRFEFSLALTGSDVQPIDENRDYIFVFDPVLNDKNLFTFLPMAIGLNLGAEYAVVQNHWLSLYTGLKYSLVGSKVNASIGPFSEVIDKSVYAHYAQIPLRLSIEILNPFYFYAGASFNYAIHYGEDFVKLYSSELLNQDWRTMAGLGWRLNHYSIYAQFEKSLFHYGKKIPMYDKTWIEPKNTIISLGITMSMDGFKKTD